MREQTVVKGGRGEGEERRLKKEREHFITLKTITVLIIFPGAELIYT